MNDPKTEVRLTAERVSDTMRSPDSSLRSKAM